MKCKKCGSILLREGEGKFKCARCGNIVLDDFGKVKEYLREHGASSKFEIAEATGVSSEKIDKFFADGRLEFCSVDGIGNVCKSCGCSIEHGRYCKICTMKTFKELQENFKYESKKDDNQKNEIEYKISGKMRTKDDFE